MSQLSYTQQVTVPRDEILGVVRLIDMTLKTHPVGPLTTYDENLLRATLDEAKTWLRAICAIEQTASTVSAGSFS